MSQQGFRDAKEIPGASAGDGAAMELELIEAIENRELPTPVKN